MYRLKSFGTFHFQLNLRKSRWTSEVFGQTIFGKIQTAQGSKNVHRWRLAARVPVAGMECYDVRLENSEQRGSK
jgi:hypothetical protein